MLLIPEHKIDEIRERVDMLALVQRHGIELKKSGRSYRGLCPFHQEKSPSFYVWPETRRFKCFGCQAGGDAISFVQRLLGKPFVDTLRDLAKELGVDLESAVDPTQREKQQLKDATDFATHHFQQRLWDPVTGHHAREYLRKRGLTDDVLRRFGLGWAPAMWTDLADRLREQGLLAFGEKAGLVSPRSKGDGYYDTFRGRVMIPIRSPEGRTIAFGGRLLEGDDGPKYLNSKESRLYVKSETLYGTDAARDAIRRKKSVVLCEGYFDAMGLHQAGVHNAVALCSTSLTFGHMTLLARLEAKELVLLLDGDEAGRKAVERLAGPILAAGQAARVAVLPEGEDPDTFARTAGASALQQLLAHARPLTEHLFFSLLPEGPSALFEAKMSAVDRLRPVVAELPVGLVRSAFFGALAKHFGLPASELEAALRSQMKDAVKPVLKPVQTQPKPDPLETMYVAAVLRNRALLAKDDLRSFDELRHAGLRTLLGDIQAGNPPEDAQYDASDVVKGAILHARDQLPADEGALEQAFFGIRRKLKLRSLEEQLARIATETAQTPGASDLTEDARALLEQRGKLLEQKRLLMSQK